MDIKVGEFVINQNRLVIGQIIAIDKEEQEAILKIEEGEIPIGFWNIKKHSFNLIDLIEIKDIVVMLDTKFNTKDYIFIDDKKMLKAVKEDLKDRCKLLEVLTHEQFEANCYKIEQK